jgi:hypothetical protein
VSESIIVEKREERGVLGRGVDVLEVLEEIEGLRRVGLQQRERAAVLHRQQTH